MNRVTGNKSDHRRISRVEREIREVVATYMIGGFKGQIDGFVSISRVIASRDLRHAKVLFTLMGETADRKAAERELQDYAHDFQREINRSLRMKYCPKLSFHYDEGFENAVRVDRILTDLEKERHVRTESAKEVSDSTSDFESAAESSSSGDQDPE